MKEVIDVLGHQVVNQCDEATVVKMVRIMTLCRTIEELN